MHKRQKPSIQHGARVPSIDQLRIWVASGCIDYRPSELVDAFVGPVVRMIVDLNIGRAVVIKTLVEDSLSSMFTASLVTD